MSVISIETAMQHLYAEPEDESLAQGLLDAAEEAAMQFMQRRFYADQSAVDAAKAGTIERTLSARAAYQEAKAQADLPENVDISVTLKDRARQVLADAYQSIDMEAFSMVITPTIQAACLLKLGHLFANREEVVTGTIATELPMASKALLMPYRIGMGV